MKNLILTLLVTFLIAGCGSQESVQEFKGITSGTNYIEQGMAYLNQSDVPRAIQSFDQAIKEDPQNPNNYLVLGQVYLRLNQFPRAIDTLNAATRVDPNNGEIYFFLATALGLKGDSRAEAVEAAQKSVEIFMQQKDEERFKRSVALLKSLSDAPEKAVSVIPNAEKPMAEMETAAESWKMDGKDK